MEYCFLPFLTWLITGSTKFLVNFIRCKFHFQNAKKLIGYGGFPSNHSAISSSILWYILLIFGYENPMFGVSLTLVVITVIDARGIRKKVESHAKLLNKQFMPKPLLRERIGHSWFEIAGGIVMGLISALFIFSFKGILF